MYIICILCIGLYVYCFVSLWCQLCLLIICCVDFLYFGFLGMFLFILLCTHFYAAWMTMKLTLTLVVVSFFSSISWTQQTQQSKAYFLKWWPCLFLWCIKNIYLNLPTSFQHCITISHCLADEGCYNTASLKTGISIDIIKCTICLCVCIHSPMSALNFH